MTTRQLIVEELGKRTYPQTVAMLREKIDMSTVQLTCRYLALEHVILERRYLGTFWYGLRAAQFQRPYRLDVQASNGQWRVVFFFARELGGRQMGAHCARGDSAPYRLLHGAEVINTWNIPEQEMDSWREAKKVLRSLNQHLRASRSPTAASTPPPTS